MIHVLADSMSDISQREAKELGISVLPLIVRFDKEEFLDGVDMLPDEFYRRLQTVTELPKTSQISPERFRSAFDRLLQKPEDEVLYISGSSKLSGTCQSARLARELCVDGSRVTVVDSLSASPGTAMLVREACRRLGNFVRASELGKWLESVRDRTHLIGQAETLKYLVMGGRLNAAAGAVGTLLHIHPMLKLEDGVMHQAGLCRSVKKMMNWFVERISEFPPDTDFPIMVSGAGCPEGRSQLRRVLEEAGFDCCPMLETDIGPVVGTYTGPGLTSVCWIART